MIQIHDCGRCLLFCTRMSNRPRLPTLDLLISFGQIDRRIHTRIAASVGSFHDAGNLILPSAMSCTEAAGDTLKAHAPKVPLPLHLESTFPQFCGGRCGGH